MLSACCSCCALDSSAHTCDETRLAWGYVLTCVRQGQDDTQVWRLNRGDLEAIKAYTAEHGPDKDSKELRAEAWSMEAKMQNLEAALRDLRWKFENHFRDYGFDKLTSEHKYAKMTEVQCLETKVGDLTLNLSRVEKEIAHEKSNLEKTDNGMKALAARVGKLEKLVTRVEKLEKPWFGLGADATAGA